MNLKVQRIIFAVLTIITCIAIFIFSSQNGDESSNTSEAFTRKIIEILQIGKDLSVEERELLIENCQFIIRKLAHFTIYTILGINVFGFINTFDIKLRSKISIGFFLGVLYAISDEIHQGFSCGRTPAIKDVCIDSLGVMFGIIIFVVIINSINRIKTANTLFSRKKVT